MRQTVAPLVVASLCFGLMRVSDPGSEVNFRTRNERMHIQDEHHFRLRHQDRFGGLLLACLVSRVNQSKLDKG
jgi:hypothetical protein